MWDDPNQPPARGYSEQPWPSYGNQGGTNDPNNAPTQRFPGSGGYGDNGYYQPPSYQPVPPSYPGERPPQWPEPDYQRSDRPLPERAPYRQAAEPRAYAPQPPIYAPPVAAERRQKARRSPSGVSLPHLPVAHVFLVAGLIAMFVAISQRWGVDASGAPVFVQDFTSTRIQSATGVDTGAAAINLARGIVGIAAILSVSLILFNVVVSTLNKILSVVGLSGCASILFFPVLWGAATLLTLVLLGAAGFAGLGFLSGLPFVQDHGISGITFAHYSAGFYLWCGGVIVVFVGMLGQLVMRRR